MGDAQCHVIRSFDILLKEKPRHWPISVSMSLLDPTPTVIQSCHSPQFDSITYPGKTQGKIDLRNESGRPMKVKVVGEVSEK